VANLEVCGVTEVGDGFVGLAERLIEAIDWGSYWQLDGFSAADIGQILTSLLSSDPDMIDAAEQGFRKVEI
jgi:hypothetical protein